MNLALDSLALMDKVQRLEAQNDFMRKQLEEATSEVKKLKRTKIKLTALHSRSSFRNCEAKLNSLSETEALEGELLVERRKVSNLKAIIIRLRK